jgi:hypothetical protein
MVSIFAKKIFSDADVKPKASCKGLAKVVSTMFGNFKNKKKVSSPMKKDMARDCK